MSEAFANATDEQLVETVRFGLKQRNWASDQDANDALEEVLERLQRRADFNRQFFKGDGTFEVLNPGEVIQRRKQAAVDMDRLKSWAAEARPWVQDQQLRHRLDDLVPPRRRSEEPVKLAPRHFKCAFCRSDWTAHGVIPTTCPTCELPYINEVSA